MSEKKRGKLSIEEMEFINRHSVDMKVEDIANAINRNIDPVIRHIEMNNLAKNNMSDVEYLRKVFRDKYYYQNLREQFSDKEMTVFELEWIGYMKQFAEDVLLTEEQQVIELIRVNLLISRTLSKQKEVAISVSNLQQLINLEMQKSKEDWDVDKLSDWQREIGYTKSEQTQYTNDYEKLVKQKNELSKQLKGTRDQRIKQISDVETSFAAYMKMLQEEENSKRQSEYMLKLQKASEHSYDKLSQLKQYVDKKFDRPLLNSETVMMDEEESELESLFQKVGKYIYVQKPKFFRKLATKFEETNI